MFQRFENYHFGRMFKRSEFKSRAQDFKNLGVQLFCAPQNGNRPVGDEFQINITRQGAAYSCILKTIQPTNFRDNYYMRPI